MNRRMKTAAAATSLVLLLGAAACGDDDDSDDASSETTAPAGEGASIEAACDALVEFSSAVTQIELDESSSEEDIKATGEHLRDLFAPMVENAPDSLKATAEELAATLDSLAEGDPSSFNSDDTLSTFGGFSGDLGDECDFQDLAVTAVDYAFEGVPDSIPAGPTSLSFTNESEAEEHEAIILRKKDGVTLTFDEIVEMPEEEAMGNVDFVGAAFAPPGGHFGEVVDLAPGDYIMICFIPVGGAEDGPPHFTQGMKHEFTVE